MKILGWMLLTFVLCLIDKFMLENVGFEIVVITNLCMINAFLLLEKFYKENI